MSARRTPRKWPLLQPPFKTFYSNEAIEVLGHDADSKMPEAPHDNETYEGALNRAQACYELGGADCYVGLESGLVERYGHFFEEALGGYHGIEWQEANRIL